MFAMFYVEEKKNKYVKDCRMLPEYTLTENNNIEQEEKLVFFQNLYFNLNVVVQII